MAQITEAEKQLEARTLGIAERVLKTIDADLRRLHEQPLTHRQRSAVRGALMQQSTAFAAVIKLEAAKLFETEVAKLKAELAGD
jgi:hypothetical protein